MRTNEIYQTKNETIDPPLRSLSLPHIKSKIIDLVSTNKPILKQRTSTETVPLTTLNSKILTQVKPKMILTKHSQCHIKKSK